MFSFKRLEKVSQMSSNEIAIRVSNISKCYEIYENPKDRLKQFLMPRIRRYLGKTSIPYFREFWALKDINFDIKRGETVGIIGRNGSGKSTLLQLICGTLNPTNGEIEVRGRVAALLELGSGFNPEFSGRENVYLNASVLGLRKEEIDDCFEEIVKFADIGEFIDQPVKTYSSGMYVRLAFSVIVHVKADILVVDEALSVGDMYFQAKCMAHLNRLIEEGVTVLFVSHDVNAVKALCNRAIYLEHGKLVAWGGTQEVVNAYFGGSIQNQQSIVNKSEPSLVEANSSVEAYHVNGEFFQKANFQRLQNGMAEYLNVVLLDQSGQELKLADHDQLVTLRMVIRTNVDIPYIATAYHIRDRSGFDVVYSDTCFEGLDITDCKAGEIFVLDWRFNISLAAGDYSIATMLSIPRNIEFADVEVCDFVPLAVQVQVGRGGKLPLHGAVHWKNELDIKRNISIS